MEGFSIDEEPPRRPAKKHRRDCEQAPIAAQPASTSIGPSIDVSVCRSPPASATSSPQSNKSLPTELEKHDNKNNEQNQNDSDEERGEETDDGLVPNRCCDDTSADDDFGGSGMDREEENDDGLVLDPWCDDTSADGVVGVVGGSETKVVGSEDNEKCKADDDYDAKSSDGQGNEEIQNDDGNEEIHNDDNFTPTDAEGTVDINDEDDNDRSVATTTISARSVAEWQQYLDCLRERRVRDTASRERLARLDAELQQAKSELAKLLSEDENGAARAASVVLPIDSATVEEMTAAFEAARDCMLKEQRLQGERTKAIERRRHAAIQRRQEQLAAAEAHAAALRAKIAEILAAAEQTKRDKLVHVERMAERERAVQQLDRQRQFVRKRVALERYDASRRDTVDKIRRLRAEQDRRTLQEHDVVLDAALFKILHDEPSEAKLALQLFTEAAQLRIEASASAVVVDEVVDEAAPTRKRKACEPPCTEAANFPALTMLHA
ncbi:Hypothetical protein UVM_LOCUS161 [uncultured virus]|nr:Hypothetical protein UVM_LOCUS161 [uncultured virus]